MIETISYVMGKKAGEKNVTLNGSDYIFTDTGDGEIVITPSEEVNNNE